MKASEQLSLLATTWQMADPRGRPGLEEQLLKHLAPFLEQQARRASIGTPARTGTPQEDAHQIARIAAVQSLISFRADRGATFWTWCYTCVRNALRDEIGRARLAQEHRGALPDYQELDDEPEILSGLPIEDRLDLYRALGKLPSELRNLVELRYFEGLTLRQIGSHCGHSGEWARKRLARALVLLRDQFGDDFIAAR